MDKEREIEEFVPQFVEELPEHGRDRFSGRLLKPDMISALKGQEFAAVKPGKWCAIAMNKDRKKLNTLRIRLKQYNGKHGMTNVELSIREYNGVPHLFCCHPGGE